MQSTRPQAKHHQNTPSRAGGSSTLGRGYAAIFWIGFAVLCSDPSSATFEISIDATALTSQTIGIAGFSTGTSTEILTESLDAGDYVLTSAGDNVSFSVTAEGTVDFDSPLDGFLDGRDTPSLVVRGFDISLDATALSLQNLAIVGSGNYGFPFTSDHATSFTLLPRDTYLLNSAGDNIYFTVDPDGNIDFGSELDGFLDGRGTQNLAIQGFDISFDATALSLQNLAIIGSGNYGFPFTSDHATSFTLLPRDTYLLNSAGDNIYFTVTLDGNIGFGSELDGFLDGRDTPSLVVRGFAISFDATSLSLQNLAIIGSGNFGFSFTSDNATSFTLLPRDTYLLNSAGDNIYFTVTLDGKIGFDSELDGFLDGRDTPSLVVRGFDISFDATALSLQNLAIVGSGNYRFPFTSDNATSFTLLPRDTYLLTSAGDNIYFTVDPEGNIGFGSELDGFLDGRGTPGITVQGFEISVDATALSVQNASITGTGNYRFPFISNHPSTFTLIPRASYLFTATSDNFLFVLDLDGLLQDLPANFQGFPVGAEGTQSLVFGQSNALPGLTMPERVPTVAGELATIPILLSSHGHSLAAMTFSIDFDQTCLDFNPVDDDGDGLPDAIILPPTPNIQYGIEVDLDDTDGELDISITSTGSPSVALPDGLSASVSLQVQCSPPAGQYDVAEVAFSSDPEVSFLNTLSQPIEGTATSGSVQIFPDFRGDCNGNGVLDVADLIACRLELFDGDGSFWLETPYGTFSGNPAGCDANGDTRVDAGDLVCKNLLLFGQSCGEPPPGSVTRGRDEPGLGLELRMSTDHKARISIELATGNHSLTGIAFSIDFDETLWEFDAGAPMAVIFPGAPVSMEFVGYDPNDSTGELDFIIADLDLEPTVLTDGVVAEVELSLIRPVESPAGSIGFGRAAASFGNMDGVSVPGATSTTGPSIFTDGFESGDALKWRR